MTKRKTDHVVMADGGAWQCLHCGDTYAMAMPCNLDVWIAASHAYVKVHARCRPGQAAHKGITMDSAGPGA